MLKVFLGRISSVAIVDSLLISEQITILISFYKHSSFTVRNIWMRLGNPFI